MTELDPDGRRLFLQFSADLYEQAIQEMHGGEPRNEGLAFWQAIRQQMDAEEAQHRRRMTVYRMLEDLAVFRMAKVQGMPLDRIGARAGRSRTWAHGHTMPQDMVDDLVAMYAEAEEAERAAFITAQAEPAHLPPTGDRGSVIPITHHPRRPAQESARKSLLYRQLRRFIGGAAAVASPIYVAMKTAAEGYTTTVQTALMSNGALTPGMAGLDPLSASSLYGAFSASGTSGAAAQATGPVSTVVGKVVASAVIGVQATAGVSAPAAVAITAAAGTPVVFAAEEAAKPIAAAFGFKQPVQAPAPAPDLLMALPVLPTTLAGEQSPSPSTPAPSVFTAETVPPPTSSPKPERTTATAAAHPPATVRAASPTTAPAASITTAPPTLAARTPAPTATAVRAAAPSPVVEQPTLIADVPAVERTRTPVVQPSPTTTAPTSAPTTMPTVPVPDPTPSLTPTEQPTTSEPTPTSVPTEQPTPPAPTKAPEPSKEPTLAPEPTKTVGPEPTAAPSSPAQAEPGDSQPQPGSAPVEQPPAVLLAGAGGSVLAMPLRPASGWWY